MSSCVLYLFTVLLINCCSSYATGKSRTACDHVSCVVMFITVTLTSSADILCPGDTVVFTCVTTDTGRLVWEINDINNRHSFHSSEKINISISLNIFTVTLLSVTNSNIYQSTAIAHNVSLDYNATNVSCNDGHTGTNSQELIIGN